MNASKENARNADSKLFKVGHMLDLHVPNKEDRDDIKRLLIQVLAFVQAAERKLPTEAAYERDAARRKQKAKA